MKKQYTKKQIQEAIAYWEKQLKTMNEGYMNFDLLRLSQQSQQAKSRGNVTFGVWIEWGGMWGNELLVVYSKENDAKTFMKEYLIYQLPEQEGEIEAAGGQTLEEIASFAAQEGKYKSRRSRWTISIKPIFVKPDFQSKDVHS